MVGAFPSFPFPVAGNANQHAGLQMNTGNQQVPAPHPAGYKMQTPNQQQVFTFPTGFTAYIQAPDGTLIPHYPQTFNMGVAAGSPNSYTPSEVSESPNNAASGSVESGASTIGLPNTTFPLATIANNGNGTTME